MIQKSSADDWTNRTQMSDFLLFIKNQTDKCYTESGVKRLFHTTVADLGRFLPSLTAFTYI